MEGLLILVIQCLFVANVRSWNQGSVLLRDVQVLTLYKGKQTTARRSSSVSQLQCVGGSAGCGSFIPDVVQCNNKGWDGVDAQWECKTDMDNAYKFGKIEVTCEGFNHPDDEYVLKGSCGLEYTLDLTEEGKRKHRGSSTGFSDYASSFFKGSSDNHQQQQNHQGHQSPSSGTDSGGLIVVALLLFLAYGVYKLFLSGPVQGEEQFSDRGPQNPNPNAYGNQGPPPPGFRPDFTGSSSFGYPGASGCSGGASYPGGANPGYGFRSGFTGQQQTAGSATAGNGSGFWTGMGAGGILGYLLGGQRRQPYTSTHTNYTQSRMPSGGPTMSTGTRTASGFGGTKRR